MCVPQRLTLYSSPKPQIVRTLSSPPRGPRVEFTSATSPLRARAALESAAFQSVTRLHKHVNGLTRGRSPRARQHRSLQRQRCWCAGSHVPGAAVCRSSRGRVAATYADPYVPEPPYCTHRLCVPASCVVYVPEAQAAAAPRYVHQPRVSRTAYRGTTGSSCSSQRSHRAPRYLRQPSASRWAAAIAGSTRSF